MVAIREFFTGFLLKQKYTNQKKADIMQKNSGIIAVNYRIL